MTNISQAERVEVEKQDNFFTSRTCSGGEAGQFFHKQNVFRWRSMTNISQAERVEVEKQHTFFTSRMCSGGKV